jgi:hypothetical protein
VISLHQKLNAAVIGLRPQQKSPTALAIVVMRSVTSALKIFRNYFTATANACSFRWSAAFMSLAETLERVLPPAGTASLACNRCRCADVMSSTIDEWK